MAPNNKPAKELAELLSLLRSSSISIDDALKLIAVLHPEERRHRTRIVYAILGAGLLLTLGSACDLVFQRPCEPVMLIPLLIGSTIVGAVLGVAIGQPSSAKQIGSLVEQLSETVTELSGSRAEAERRLPHKGE